MVDPFEPGREYTVEEYLRLENLSDVKHEYLDGQVYPLGSPPQPTPLPRAYPLYVALTERMQTLINKKGLEIEMINAPSDKGATLVIKPALDGEVESGKRNVTEHFCVVLLTSDFDYVRTYHDQFEGYLNTASAVEIAWFFADTPRSQIYRRNADKTWLITFVDSLDCICDLRSIDVQFKLADVYAGILLPTDRTQT